MSKALYLLCFCLIVLNSCKSTEGVGVAKVKKLSSEKVITNHYKQSFDFKTLNSRIRVNYTDGKQSFSPIATLRLEKDKTIWISVKMLGITLAKALITPEKVSYYEKINNTFFDGDFRMLSEWLGTELDFEKVQQMLLGQALFDLKQDKYKVAINEQNYVLKPKEELELFERLFLIQPETFKIASQQLTQTEEQRNLSIDYKGYQKIGNQDFPKQIHIKATQETKETNIVIDYKSVDYNAKVSFPFKIPSGYKQVTIK
ncbi:DUF4292 domain-containing protein [Aquimarina algicola]|uniref:DUF4292 domain-containing protein n=1 Tax=Aquimarina algicola TaxID=2589995 RepID=A0A504JNC7_9FLAO|nr:DUF4292 domain-containing protein [Aquimarina algicola]TPN87920.1 DUF4292 domain-containing protein [Aquimarina algicola]